MIESDKIKNQSNPANLAAIDLLRRQIGTLVSFYIKLGYITLADIIPAVRSKLLENRRGAKSLAADESLVSNMVEDAFSESIQLPYYIKLYESVFYHNYLTNDVMQFHPASRTYELHKLANLKTIVAATDTAFSLESMNKMIKCQFRYEPHKSQLTWCENGIEFFNTYRPPKWKEEFFFGGAPIQPAELPPLIERFLWHLCDNDEASVEYILDWAANSVRARNRCYLVAVGDEGVGKGTLYNILRHPHVSYLGGGSWNCAEDVGGRFANRFNGHLQNTTLIYLNEITRFDESQANAAKKLADDEIQYEGKGLAAIVAKNHASVYFTSNNISSVPISSSDRRYSVIELTSRRLIEVFSAEEINRLNGSDEQMLDEFARYLWFRKVDAGEINKVFRSKKKEDLQLAALTGWRDYIISDWCVAAVIGKKYKYGDIKRDIKTYSGDRESVNGLVFKQFASGFPKHIRITYDESRNPVYESLTATTAIKARNKDEQE